MPRVSTSPGVRFPAMGGPRSRLRAARLAAGLTQAELAERAGLSARTIFSIEKGRGCHQQTKKAMLQALEIPFSQRHYYFD